MSMPKLAVFDLTDCEGCELQIINLKEKMLQLLEHVDIVNWRLVEESDKEGPFDVALVEGCAQTEHDIQLIKELREKTRILVALGACACIGGIPSLATGRRERRKLFDIVYGPEYKPKALDTRPIQSYVKVDFHINGCPVTLQELEKYAVRFLLGRRPRQTPFPVCMECKFRENECLLIQNKVCLGPITQGGCEAICIAEGKHCYGCHGPFIAANMEGMKTRLEEFLSDSEIDDHLSIFLRSTAEYERVYE